MRHKRESGVVVEFLDFYKKSKGEKCKDIKYLIFDSKLERGNANYKGWRVEALYALTDNLTLNTCIEASREISRSLGGRHRHSMFHLEAIYAF